MKMVHKNCGGRVAGSTVIPPYQSEEYGIVPAYQCDRCFVEITGDAQIGFVAESAADQAQVEALQ